MREIKRLKTEKEKRGENETVNKVRELSEQEREREPNQHTERSTHLYTSN
jgi:hypothetical protein